MIQYRCSPTFPKTDRERGAGYFRQGRVDLGPPGLDTVAAVVAGTGGSLYQVHVDWSGAEEDGTILTSCRCTRFDETGFCKHVWATFLALDAAYPTLPIASSANHLEVVPDWDRGADDPDPDVALPRPLARALPRPVPAATERSATATARPKADGASAAGASLAGASLAGVSRAGASPAGASRAGGGAAPTAATRVPSPAPPDWRRLFAELRGRLSQAHLKAASKPREAHFHIDVQASLKSGNLVVSYLQREATIDGGLGELKPLNLTHERALAFPAPDRRILEVLLAVTERAPDPFGASPRGWGHSPIYTRAVLKGTLCETILPLLAANGRLAWVSGETKDETPTALEWDAGPVWQLLVNGEQDGDEVSLSGRLRRGRQIRDLSEAVLLLASGIVVFRNRVGLLKVSDDFGWIALLRREGELRIPRSQLENMLTELWKLPSLPELALPEAWRFEEVTVAPRPRLTVTTPRGYSSKVFLARVSFVYEGQVVRGGDPPVIVDGERRRVLRRDERAEQAALIKLEVRDFREPDSWYRDQADYQISRRAFPAVLGDLLAQGWIVERDGELWRHPGAVDLRVASSIDWFELSGAVDFGGRSLGFPELLASLRKGRDSVTLDDGSRGYLPEDWLQRYRPLAELAEDAADGLRFRPSQTLILDALLAAEPHVDFDRKFEQWRQRLRSFERIEPRSEPRGFQGELRPYQREGLGWFRFLDQLGLGGCLADDMGLGKTVQVLALLQWRRLRPIAAEDRLPSLVVAPRSVLDNWVLEAERFAPRLRVLRYHGTHRRALLEEIDEADLVVTTYGTLRRDVATFVKTCEFDYAVLDEAQNIKNASSQAAKASRLIHARHRLALTGTPVENHLGELWSIFEFLNPGMLGRLPRLRKMAGKRTVDHDALETLANALRPFILRRTKEEVLDDLPEKTEQTLSCELDRRQRRLYNELRNHYRSALRKRIDKVGLGKAKIHILEALLRLRQAACHPGLIDKDREKDSSAKLEALLDDLCEIVDEGHKALVFSQFTSLLAIVRRHLEAAGLTYEYLDGRTRKRQERVDRFQTDPDCPIFLISLKAGGLGLNLTAADYVYILDPWWNPAVEAQAVDRAHRMGQTRPVFAYRLIAADTVEEKIVELQESKRELADAILAADSTMIGDLSAEDLRFLLS